MTRPLVVEPEARQELEDAVWWYEQQRSSLGRRFLAAVELALEQVAGFPGTGARVPHVSPDLPVRRMAVAGFPYHVVYLETSAELRVLAVAHDRREPGYWLERAGS